MKIRENGKVRKMTEKEIAHHKAMEERMRKELGFVDGYEEPTFENFIVKMAQAKKPDDVIAIAREFDSLLHPKSEV